MLEESSDKINNNKYPNTTKNRKENIICKDGFCSLPNQSEISKQNENDMNFFDPI